MASVKKLDCLSINFPEHNHVFVISEPDVR